MGHDMDNLKAPIPGDAPFGIYLKGDKPTYRALRNAFNAAQASWRSLSETQESLEDRELAAANTAAWAGFAERAEATLIETSKDLEILTWFTAAQVHGARPLPDCAAALALVADLVEHSLDKLQPVPPPEKLKGDSDETRAAEIAELRLRPFVQLVGEVEGTGLLTGPVTALPLIGDVTYGRFVLADKAGALDPLRAEAAAVIGTEAETLNQKVEALQKMVRHFDQLDSCLKSYAAKHGQTPPLIGYGRRLATEVLAAVERLVEGLGFPWPGAEVATEEVVAPQADTAEAEAPAGGGARTRSGGGGGLGFDAQANAGNRDEALMAIAGLATYFRKSEPHSPICLLLDRAVRWGNLSAGELFREILSDGSVGMSQMALMTGLESQGFADHFGKRGAGVAGGVDHPSLPDYAAALPIPARSEPDKTAPMPVPAAALAVAQPEPAAAAPSDTPQASAETASEIDPNLPVEDFQW